MFVLFFLSKNKKGGRGGRGRGDASGKMQFIIN